VTENRPLLDRFPPAKSCGSKEAALDIEDQLPDTSERNRAYQNPRSPSAADGHVGQIEANPLHGQNTTGFSHLDVSNRQERFADGTVSTTPAASLEESLRTGQSKAENDAPLRREGVLRASRANAVNDHLQEAGGERSQGDDEHLLSTSTPAVTQILCKANHRSIYHRTFTKGPKTISEPCH
jgi:hypothetical protein